MRCQAGYMPADAAVGCHVLATAVATMNVCVEQGKGITSAALQGSLDTTDLSTATELYLEELRASNVDVSSLAIRFLDAIVTEGCPRPEHSRALRKSESVVDQDGKASYNVAFKYQVLGNALNVHAAEVASNHVGYHRTRADVLNSAAWLNYGRGRVEASMRKLTATLL